MWLSENYTQHKTDVSLVVVIGNIIIDIRDNVANERNLYLEIKHNDHEQCVMSRRFMLSETSLIMRPRVEIQRI